MDISNMSEKLYNIAVVGATGNVGQEVLKILDEVNFPINQIYALASDASVGKLVSRNLKQTLTVESLAKFDPSETNIDIAFFCVDSNVSRLYIDKFKNNGCIVIDKSSAFRMDKDVPLVIPEVNINDLELGLKTGIICTPNCTVTPLAMIAKPLDDLLGIKRVVVTTLQSVSGTSKSAMDELFFQTKSFYETGFANDNDKDHGKVYQKRIAFNCIPQCGEFLNDGNTTEENKIKDELSKILHKHIPVSATCIRVPVFVGHSLSINFEFEKDFDIKDIQDTLSSFDGLVLYGDDDFSKYITPYEVVGTDVVFVSRVRKDDSVANCLNLWCCCDNIRKGAALNGVQIAQKILELYM